MVLGAHAVLLVATCVALYPVVWVVALALRGDGALEPSVLPWPDEPSLANFETVVTATDRQGRWLFGRQLAASVIISGATALVAIVISTSAGYALSRWRFPGRDAGIGLLLTTQMFPSVAMAIPLYVLLDVLGLLDTWSGLVLVYASTAIPFGVFSLKGYFDTIPRDLEEAAMVDGATRLGAFVRVVLPAARPALAVTALFAFMTAWNEFVLAATFISEETRVTLPVALQRFVGSYDAKWGPFAAGAIVVSIPVMALFYALQRHLVSGLTSGGVKG
ncbi:MAG: ABC transporter permease subunit [Deltaproteobacteria bacterium]|nr:ABC transporter permease subunit [Deltaproteobacteria bacterium]